MMRDEIQLIFQKTEKKLAFYMIKIKSPTLLLGKKDLLDISNMVKIRTNPLISVLSSHFALNATCTSGLKG